METLHALDAETTQTFLNRIYPYNSLDLPDFGIDALAHELNTARCRTMGEVALGVVPPFDSHKFPAAESVAESTQEMAIPVLPETTLVEVKTVRMGADPRLVPFGEDPRNYPTGNRQRFFLANVVD